MDIQSGLKNALSTHVTGAILLLALGTASAHAQVAIGEDFVPGLGDYALMPSKSAGLGLPYAVLAASNILTDNERFDAAGSQIVLQSGARNTSLQVAAGALNQTVSYQLGLDNAVIHSAIGTVASRITTLQYGAQNDSTAIIVGGVSNRSDTLQVGTQNAGQILIYGSSNANVGLVQAGTGHSRSIAVVGSAGVNVLVVQR